VQVRSLGYRTDLIFNAFEGQVIDHGDHLSIRTPSNPSFYWGNYLLFKGPPQAGDYERWRALFAREIGSPPGVNHESYGWDSTQGEKGEVAPFLDGGFELSHSAVMAAERVVPPGRLSAEVSIRPLKSDDDWLAALENQVLCREPEHEEDAYRAFVARRMDSYRLMTSAGIGEWFGAFSDAKLVADLGLFHDGRLARYQAVETHPDYRRRGFAASLVYQAALHAFTHYGIETLVIVADHGSAAARLYHSLGFDQLEEQVGLERARLTAGS
jgi:ribosomal protein S18 acetylase RimI-like enzyme